MSRNDLPNESAPNFNVRLRETLMTYLGKVGDPMDRGITLRDLVDSGIVSIANLASAKSSNPLSLNAGSKTQTGGSPDLTPPPTPTGFTVSAAITSLFIQHDKPLYTQGHGHLRTHVYGVVRSPNDPLPTFSSASEIQQFSGTVSSCATNPATIWHLWIKWETADGVLSASPAGGTNGLTVTTGQDVSLLLQALTGQITESQLYKTLGDRIALVDGPATLTNSIAYLLAEEATLRTNAINSEATARTNAITLAAAGLQNQINTISAASSGDVGALITAVRTEQDARNAADLAFSGQVSTLTAVANNEQAAIKTEEIIRSTQDSAQTTQTSLLIARTGENVAGLQTEINTRSTADSAQASQTTALFAATGQNLAGLQTETTARTTDASSQAAQTTYLVAKTSDTTAALFTETTLRSTADSAQALQTASLTATTGQTYAGLVTETTARTTDASAQAAQTSTLYAAVGSNIAGLQTETTARTTDTSAQAAQTSFLQTAVGANTAGLSTENTARSTADSAQAAQTSTLFAAVGANTAGLSTEINARATDTSSQLSQIATALASSGNSLAATNTETQLRTIADSANASQINQLQVSTGNSISGLAQERTLTATDTQALASQVTAITASIGSNSAAIQTEQTARTTDSQSFANQVTGIAALTANTYSSITEERNARAAADSASAATITTLQSTAAGNTAALQTLATTTAGPNGATAQYTVKTDIGGRVAGFGLSSTVSTIPTSISIASSLSGAVLTYVSNNVNRDVNLGNVYNGRILVDTDNSGTVTSTDAFNIQKFYTNTGSLATTTRDYIGTTMLNIMKSNLTLYSKYLQNIEDLSNASEFVIRADRFSISAPVTSASIAPTTDLYTGFAWLDTSVSPSVTRYYDATAATWGLLPPQFPFVVQATPTTINGVAVPAGVYMTDAYIQNGTITNAKIANAAIDTAKITDANITSAKIADANITSAKIADAAITTAKIGDAQITTAKIGDAQITTAKIGDAQITNAKIDTLDATKITTGTLDAGRIAASSITAGKINSNGLEIRDTTGKLLLGSNGLTMQGLGSNLLRSSGFEDGIAGYNASYYTTAVAPVIGWNLNTAYNLRGAGLAYIAVGGGSSPSVGQVFDFRDVGTSGAIPVTPGTRYEAHVLLNTHRCGGKIVIAWLASDQTYIGEVGGSEVAVAASELYDLTQMTRSGVFAVAPTNARFCIVVARGLGTGGINPYLFIKNMYFGQATVAQTDYTPWSPGRGVGQITASNASTFIADAAVNTLQIAGQAVTIPISAYSAGGISVSGSDVLLQSASINTLGFPLQIWASFWMNAGSTNAQLGYFTLKRNGTTIWNSIQSVYYTAYTTFSFAFAETPPEGANTYEIFFRIDSGTGVASARSIVLLGVKR